MKWRIEPQFLQNNEVVMVNLDKWNKLSQQARDLLQKIAIEYEKESMDKVEQESAKELKRLQAAGMQTVELKGDYRKKYLEIGARHVLEEAGKVRSPRRGGIEAPLLK